MEPIHAIGSDLVRRTTRDAGGHREAVVDAALRGSDRGATGAPGARGAERVGIRLGDDVVHEKFGEGVVIDLQGDGDKAEVRVRFVDAGEKWLLLAWAPLRRIDPTA